MIKSIDHSKFNDAIMKHNSARGANTTEFPIGKFVDGGGGGGEHNGENTIYSRWRP
jgi:hypothetical protein